MDLFFDQDRQGWTTLVQAQTPQRRRWSLSLILSAVVHSTVLLVLCLPALPIFVRPSFIARGEGGTATPESTKLYLPADFQIAARVPPLLSLPVAVRNKTQKTKLQ